MSKLITLITTLALGSSASVAMASSSRSFDRRTEASRTRVERDRGRAVRPDLDRGWNRRDTGDDFGPRRYRPTWVALSAPLQLGRDLRASVRVSDRNTFTQLRLQAAGDIAQVDRVIVRFADGSDQVANLGRVLDQPSELLEIQLDGNNRLIDRITVIGRGNLELFGI